MHDPSARQEIADASQFAGAPGWSGRVGSFIASTLQTPCAARSRGVVVPAGVRARAGIHPAGPTCHSPRRPAHLAGLRIFET